MATVLVKVCVRSDKVKYVIVPKHSKIKGGEYVMVSNNEDLIKKVNKEVTNGRRKS